MELDFYKIFDYDNKQVLASRDLDEPLTIFLTVWELTGDEVGNYSYFIKLDNNEDYNTTWNGLTKENVITIMSDIDDKTDFSTDATDIIEDLTFKTEDVIPPIDDNHPRKGNRPPSN